MVIHIFTLIILISLAVGWFYILYRLTKYVSKLVDKNVFTSKALQKRLKEAGLQRTLTPTSKKHIKRLTQEKIRIYENKKEGITA